MFSETQASALSLILRAARCVELCTDGSCLKLGLVTSEYSTFVYSDLIDGRNRCWVRFASLETRKGSEPTANGCEVLSVGAGRFLLCGEQSRLLRTSCMICNLILLLNPPKKRDEIN